MAYFAVVVLTVIAILAISALLGEKTTVRRATGEPFESGVASVGTANLPISVDFYLVAMFFVIFDLETTFIFAWAIAFYDLGLIGYIEICVFILVLAIALVYAWRSGALEWGVRPRKSPVVPSATIQPVAEQRRW